MKVKDALKQNIQAYTNHNVFADRMSIFSKNGSYTCFMLFAVYFSRPCSGDDTTMRILSQSVVEHY